ncbi:hypothetical protein HOLleu_39937 [Holothuria leucospilota]|uniref:Uncharacterized protein n=1 Tax=Holothuria leucospilota TaxID=206669 RepID=A0A9Q0YDM0_HOLLE|nr:hypothetical protein HOLleu_39937 [Holothuria leucospilota]
MNRDWQGSYVCTVDNGVEVSFVLNVSLAEDGLPATPGAGGRVPSVLDPPRAKPLTGAVIVLSFLLMIASFSTVAICIVHCGSQQDNSENRDNVVRSKLTQNRFLKFLRTDNISNKYTLPQKPTENQRSSTTENTRENLSDSNEILYENARHSSRERGQSGRDVKKNTGSKIISVKYDEDMSVYYNVSQMPSPTTDKSNECYNVTKTDDTEYTGLNIHEITKPTSEAYQPITVQSDGHAYDY